MYKEKLKKIIARAYKDEEFKKKLLEDAMSVFNEYGMGVSEGKTIRVVEEGDSVTEDDPNIKTIVLPKKESGELSDAELEGVAGGQYRLNDIIVCRR